MSRLDGRSVANLARIRAEPQRDLSLQIARLKCEPAHPRTRHDESCGLSSSNFLVHNAPMLMYLHGFRSAPASLKARMLMQRMDELGLGDHVWCEQLPIAPAEAIRFVEEQIARDQTPITLVGSSLGGFYATYLAEKHDLRAVLINPAVVAHLTLADYLGPQSNSYTGEQFALTAEHIRQLEALNLTTLTDPGRFWVLVETGDEVLDFRVAVERYAGARQTVIEGGDHSFQHFDQFLDGIIEFAGLLR